MCDRSRDVGRACRAGPALGLVLAAVCLLAGGCASMGPAREHWASTYNPERRGTDRQAIVKHFNMHRGRWWNYYSRGRWYLEYGHVEPAEADFRRALRLRGTDKRGARSYGMHFWDYFPRRELGIALLRRGQPAEAAKQLQASLAAEESSRAKFYLNKARAEVLRQSRADKEAPTIKVEVQAGRILTNRTTFALRAAVTDDQFVRSISVAGRELFVELARPRIDVREDVRLRPGENVVAFEAIDLAGRQTTERITVTLDVRPPVVCVGPAGANQGAGADALGLTALDDIGLREIRVAGRTIPCDGAKQRVVTGLAAKPGAAGLPIAAVDLAGNITTVTVDVPGASPAGAARGGEDGGGAAIASGRSDAIEAVGVAGPSGPAVDRTGPVMKLGLPKGLTKLTVGDEELFLDGHVKDPAGIRALTVNGEPIPLAGRQSTLVGFSRFVRLQPGLNTIEVVAIDQSGNRTRTVVEVHHSPSDLFRTAGRYTVALAPLKEIGPGKGKGAQAYGAILGALTEDPSRFNVVERQEEAMLKIMREHKLTALAEPSKALRLGKLVSAEGLLFGVVDEDAAGITLGVRFVDTETGKLHFFVDAFSEGTDDKAIRWCARGLISKIEVRFPLVRCNVADREGRRIYLDVGRNRALRLGMKLLLYRVKALGQLRLTKPIESEGRQLEAKIDNLDETSCSAQLRDKTAAARVEVGNMAITK